MLSLMRQIGEMVLGLLPALADPRTVELLKQTNYRSQAHMETFIGIKACLVIAVLFLGIISASDNPLMLFWCIPATAFGWYVPNFILAGRAKK